MMQDISENRMIRTDYQLPVANKGNSFLHLPVHRLLDNELLAAKVLNADVIPELALDAQTLDQYPEDLHRKLADKFKKNSHICSVQLPFHDLQTGSTDSLVLEATRSRLLKAIKLAILYDPVYIVAYNTFNSLYTETYCQWLKRSVETWKIVLDRVQDYFALYLRNFQESDPRPLEDLLGELSSYQVKFSMDIGFWSIYAAGEKSDDSLSFWLQSMSSYLTNMHLKSSDDFLDEELVAGRLFWQQLFESLHLLDLYPSITYASSADNLSFFPEIANLAGWTSTEFSLDLGNSSSKC